MQKNKKKNKKKKQTTTCTTNSSKTSLFVTLAFGPEQDYLAPDQRPRSQIELSFAVIGGTCNCLLFMTY